MAIALDNKLIKERQLFSLVKPDLTLLGNLSNLHWELKRVKIALRTVRHKPAVQVRPLAFIDHSQQTGIHYKRRRESTRST